MRPPVRVLELRSVRGTGGGPEKTILLGARRADPERFRVTVCYLRDRRDQEFDFANRAAQAGIDYREVVERHSFDPTVYRRLRRLVTALNIDIVHAHEYKTDLLAYLLGQSGRIVPISTAHGWSGVSFKEQYLYYPVDKRLLARFPRVIAVSNAIRQELIRCGGDPDRIAVVLNGIDTEVFMRRRSAEPSARSHFSIPQDAYVIGAVGRLEQEKRFDILLRAAALLPRDKAPLVVVAGEGSQRVALEQLARDLGVAATCRLIGLTPDVVQLHHALDLFVQSSEREGTPNAVLEAMALETPIVATEVGGTHELVSHGVHALLVPKNDPRALADAIEQAMTQPEDTRRRATAARIRVEQQLSFARRMEQVERVYEQLVDLRPRAMEASAG